MPVTPPAGPDLEPLKRVFFLFCSGFRASRFSIFSMDWNGWKLRVKRLLGVMIRAIRVSGIVHLKVPVLIGGGGRKGRVQGFRNHGPSQKHSAAVVTAFEEFVRSGELHR